MIKNKQMKALIGNVISGNKQKSEILVKELVESTVAEREAAIFESFFRNLKKDALNG